MRYSDTTASQLTQNAPLARRDDGAADRRAPRRARRCSAALVVVATAFAAGPATSAPTAADVVVRLAVTDLGGTPVTQVRTGDRIVLSAFVEDVRPGAAGVFAAYIDVTYPARVSVASAITPGGAFPNGAGGSTSALGLLDNVGSFAGLTPTGAGESLLFSVEIAAIAAGDVTFQSSAADQTVSHAILVHGSDAEVTDVTFGAAHVTVTPGPPPPGPVSSFLLPKKARLRTAPHPGENARLTVSGYLDTGPTPLDPAAEARLQIGHSEFAVAGLAKKGKRALLLTGPDVSLTITPPKSGSSRAKFKLLFTETATNELDEGVPIQLRLTSGDIDASGVFDVQRGKFLLGRGRGALTEPALYVLAAKGKLAGDGRDSLELTAGLTSITGTPSSAPAVTVSLGDAFSASVAGSAFRRKGSRNVFVRKSGAPGVTSLVLDFDRGTLKLVAKGIDLGPLPEGAQPLLLTINTGEPRAVPVRMVRRGKKLSY